MYKQEYKRWCNLATEDPDLQTELHAIEGDSAEIEERFAAGLSFGTAGLRGVLGAGPGRMNIYTISRATAGLAAYIHRNDLRGGVAIAYDSRNKSTLFAQRAAGVLAAAGIPVFIYDTLMPTPALSFAVRELHCAAGIMVTASHNPAKYNGYKVYASDGCQITTGAANAILAEIENTPFFNVPCIPFEQAIEEELVFYVKPEVEEAFYNNVKAQSAHPELLASTGLKVVFTPLYGTGNLPVRKVLGSMGLKNLTVVREQELPNGDFPTCPYPNPEIRQALELGIAQCVAEDADLLLATDPDADRLGTAVKCDKTPGGYRLLTGNEVGVLLADYLLQARTAAGTLPEKPVLVRSIVSTSLADAVAAKYGAKVKVVLTGFKYIGEQIALLEDKGQKERFVFGFEESYGYLAGTYVRDKDAVVASMLVCEMAAYYHAQGKGLAQRLEELGEEFGVYEHTVDSFEFEGLAGMQKMGEIMQGMRANAPDAIAGKKVTALADYASGEVLNIETGERTKTGLPTADILIFTLEGNAQVIVRPSGTEPKIKAYYTAIGESVPLAQELLAELKAAISAIILA